MTQDTIAAVSTASGEFAISIVRISGPKAKTILQRIFKPTRIIKTFKSHKLYHGHILSTAEGKNVDEVLATWMQEPYTYTREDVAEINTHGGHLVTRRVLELVLEHGARPAEPGEFTKRAFLNGRIDLLQAEAVAGVIRARSDEGLNAALTQLAGNPKPRIAGIKEAATELLAGLEAVIDFPEDEVRTVPKTELSKAIGKIREDVEALLERIRWGNVVREGVQVVITGPPNAGKSTLLNSLLERERAIVTDLPGTTRDAIEEQIQIHGMLFTFIDTAGLGKPSSRIGKAMQEKTREYLERAQILLLVLDTSSPFRKKDLEILRQYTHASCLAVLNKSDLPPKVSPGEVSGVLAGVPVMQISAKEGKGIKELKSTVYELFEKNQSHRHPGALFVEIEQQTALREGLVILDEFSRDVEQGAGEEILAENLGLFLRKLGDFSGESISEDVLERIFSRFCIGK